MRARALRAPAFLSSLAPQTGRCAPPLAYAASLLLIRPLKIYKIYRTWAPHVKGFLHFPLDRRGYEIGPNFVPFFLFLYRFLIFSFCYSLLILLSFFNFFSFIYSYSCLLIGSYSSYSSRTTVFFVVLFFSSYTLICLLYYTHTQIMYTSSTIRPYFCFLNFYFCYSLLILLFTENPAKCPSLAKNPPKYTTAYLVQ